MTDLVLIAAGAFAGAIVRYLLSWWRSSAGTTFPYGILAANVAGSLALGILLAGASPDAYLLAGVGFCGALTTFSTFSLDTLVLAREGRRATAVLNVGVSVVACVAAAALGLAVGTALGLSA